MTQQQLYDARYHAIVPWVLTVGITREGWVRGARRTGVWLVIGRGYVWPRSANPL